MKPVLQQVKNNAEVIFFTYPTKTITMHHHWYIPWKDSGRDHV